MRILVNSALSSVLACGAIQCGLTFTKDTDLRYIAYDFSLYLDVNGVTQDNLDNMFNTCISIYNENNIKVNGKLLDHIKSFYDYAYTLGLQRYFDKGCVAGIRVPFDGSLLNMDESKTLAIMKISEGNYIRLFMQRLSTGYSLQYENLTDNTITSLKVFTKQTEPFYLISNGSNNTSFCFGAMSGNSNIKDLPSSWGTFTDYGTYTPTGTYSMNLGDSLNLKLPLNAIDLLNVDSSVVLNGNYASGYSTNGTTSYDDVTEVTRITIPQGSISGNTGGNTGGNNSGTVIILKGQLESNSNYYYYYK